MNILVVDDEPAVRRLEIRVLESAGHTCYGAASTDQALAVRGNSITVAEAHARAIDKVGLVALLGHERRPTEPPLSTDSRLRVVAGAR